MRKETDGSANVAGFYQGGRRHTAEGGITSTVLNWAGAAQSGPLFLPVWDGKIRKGAGALLEFTVEQKETACCCGLSANAVFRQRWLKA